jgi:hypothetical protein
MLLPPGPLQINVYEVVAPTAPVVCEPLTPSEPVQPPEAVHDVAWVELHVNVELPPGAITEGRTESVAVGAGFGVTATAAVATGLVPPGPEQVRENVALAVSAPVVFVPLAASGPLQSPPAAHAVA